MARRRLQKKGYIYKDGRWWRLRWREDCGDGQKIKRVRRSTIIGLASGPGALTKRQAESQAWETILSKVDQFASVPQSMMTFGQFVTQRFEPEHIWTLKHAGKEHYKFCLGKIIPAIGEKRLRDIKPTDIYSFIRKISDSGKSIQTVAHIKKAIGMVFNHAKAVGCYVGENPASLVKLPKVVNKESRAFTFDEARLILRYLPQDIRLMAILSMTTSLNVAELCGLRRKHTNTTEEFGLLGSTAIQPRSIIVREDYYRNRYGTPKTDNRKRTVPIPDGVLSDLVTLMDSSKFKSPDDPVFPGKTGKPIDAHNTNNRLFRKVSKAILEKHGKDIKITWHMFRHSCATFAEQVGMQRSDAIALMGHGSGKMTDLYTHSDNERRRGSVSQIAGRLLNFGPSFGQESEQVN